LAIQGTRLLSLPFRLSPERHRLGLIDEDIQNRLLLARKAFAERLPESLSGSIAFFDLDKINTTSSVQDNLLFGKIAYGRPQSEVQVRAALSQVLQDLDLIQAVVDIGLSYEVGVAGSRLSGVQRQKLAIARAIIKQPDMLILNNPFGSFDEALRQALIDRILRAYKGRSIVAVLDQIANPDQFDCIFQATDSRITEVNTREQATPKAAE
jgi:putative ABC transport system ATP-binding protein